jgi:outer membrane protein OmpA-like peptidoglycan-associated protein
MKFTVIIFVFLEIFTVNIFAQKELTTKSKKAIKLYQDASVQANLYNLPEAIHLLKKAIAEDKNFIEAYLVLGEFYQERKQDSLAIETLTKATLLNPDFFPPVYSNLAKLEFNTGYYDKSIGYIKKYLSYPSQNSKFLKDAETLKKKCEFASQAVKNPVPFKPEDLGPNINTKYDQYWPSLSADEQTLVFTVLLPIDSLNPESFRNRQEDFYYSTFENGQWTPARPVGPPLNTTGNEGAQAISADGKLMIFTGCNRPDGYGSCDLYFSIKRGETWSKPQNIGRPINTSAKETQPSISADGRTIYFSSNRSGTKGSLDIWKSTLTDDGEWSNPVNLGDSINTEFEEQSPFIHPDNQTLYFSSNGWPGLGNYDLFISRRINDSCWTVPKNLGYPINTHFDEEGLIVNSRGNKAYYSSNRFSKSGRDIYSFDLYKEVRPTLVSYMKGKVFDEETKQTLVAHFELIDLATSKTVIESYSSRDGSFLICLPSGKNYALNVNKKGYLFYSDNFTMSRGAFTEPYLKDVPLKPIKIGETVIMKNIFFDFDSYILKPESKIELDKLSDLLKDNPLLNIEIGGHTDNSGTPEYNQKLSENRALAVKDYLVSNTITSKRITAKGYGEKQPIATNDTDEGRALNRRTEFKVTGK